MFLEKQALTKCDTTFRNAPVSVTLFALPSAVKITPRNAYILRYPNATSNWVCKTWASMICPSNTYALQLPVDDDNGFLIKPLLCRPYTTCVTGQYMKVNGMVTGDRDNVCVTYSTCNKTAEYVTQEGNATADFVCRPYTQCTAGLEYLLRRGDSKNDNICVRKTFCAAQSHRSMYEKIPPVDSISWGVPGRDASCMNISTCPEGKYVSVSATDTSDVVCEFCPRGMYKSSNMLECNICPDGYFSDTMGATQCKQCTNCLSKNVSNSSRFVGNNALCMFSNASLCRNAFSKVCQNNEDAVCMKCPVEEKVCAHFLWSQEIISTAS